MVSLQYGADTMSARLPWAKSLGVLDAAERAALPDVPNVLKHALEHPLGMDGALRRRFQPNDTVVIAVSDASRNTGMEQVLPFLADWLLDCGISEESVSFIVATGAHRAATEEEKSRILGIGLYRRFQSRIFNHDARDDANLVRVGATRRGTEVTLNKRALECDHLILTGAVAPHYFAGFSGGRKALVPGLAGVETIAANHARSLDATESRLDPRVRICEMDGNPVAEDLLDAARLHPPAFIVNTVLDRNGRIAGLFVGELDIAHRHACALAGAVYTARIAQRADLVIAAMRAAPNFIQCHKALFNAYNALKPGGRIILLAPMREGLGGERFREYLDTGDPNVVAAALRRRPDINGQTVLSTLEKAPQSILVTELSESDVQLLRARKAAALDDALRWARDYFAACGVNEPTCYLMPNAGGVVPIVLS